MPKFLYSLLLLFPVFLFADDHRQPLVISYEEASQRFVQRVGDPIDLTDDPDESLRDEYLRRPHASVATLHQYFEEAGAEFGVPVPLLKAFGQYATNWTQVGPSRIGGWGVMQLVQNEMTNTLGEAAALLHVDEQLLKDDARANIRGVAALLAHYAGDSSVFTRLEDWQPAVAKATGLAYAELQERQAEAIYEILREDTETISYWNEPIELEASSIDMERVRPRLAPTVTGANGTVATLSIDYRSAAERLIGCNVKFTKNRNGKKIDTWVNHWVATPGSTYESNIQFFLSCQGKNTSAHFIVSTRGDITQLVRVNDTAHHAGNMPDNYRTIGVEHQVTTSTKSDWENLSLLRASAGMARYFAKQFGIPATRKQRPGVMGHNEVKATDCPGPLPWNLWMTLFRGHDLRITTRPTLSPDPIKTGKAVTVTAKFRNAGSATYNGTLAAALHDAYGNYLGDIEVKSVVLGAGETKTISFAKSKISSKPGTYQLHLKYRLSEGNEWRLLPPDGSAASKIIVTIK